MGVCVCVIVCLSMSECERERYETAATEEQQKHRARHGTRVNENVCDREIEIDRWIDR